MKIIDGTNTQTKSARTSSVDVHLDTFNEYINVVLPNGRILVVEATKVTLFDTDESQIKSMEL